MKALSGSFLVCPLNLAGDGHFPLVVDREGVTVPWAWGPTLMAEFITS